MKQIVPWRDDRRGDDNRVISVLFGVSSLAIGLGGTILLLSLLVGKPIGSLLFFDVALVPVVSTDTMGSKILEKPAEFMVPTIGLLGASCLGALLGGLGIYLTKADKKDRPARMSASGLIACTVALVLAWLVYTLAWW
jgi:hypothetical protein